MYNLPNKPLIVPDKIITPFSDFNSSLILQCGSDKLSLDKYDFEDNEIIFL